MMDAATQDHDLLIEIKTKVGGLIDEVRYMRDDTGKKVEMLDNKKLDASDFAQAKLEAAKEHLAFDNRIIKLEGIVDKMSQKMWFAMGAFSVVNVIISSILIPIVLKYIQ